MARIAELMVDGRLKVKISRTFLLKEARSASPALPCPTKPRLLMSVTLVCLDHGTVGTEIALRNDNTTAAASTFVAVPPTFAIVSYPIQCGYSH